MSRTTRIAARSVGAVAVVALGLGLGACSGDLEPGAAPSESEVTSPSTPSASADPTEAAQKKNVADATARYEEFLAISTENAKKGESAFDELLQGGYFGDPELQSRQDSYWRQFTKQKLKQSGDREVTSVELAEYEGDPLEKDVLGHRVQLQVCLDNSAVDVVKPDGSSAIQEGVPVRMIMDVVLQGQEDGRWAVRESTGTGEDC